MIEGTAVGSDTGPRRRRRMPHPLIRYRFRRAVRGYRPRDRWHSWESNPAQHPWLTREHLEAILAFSESIWSEAEALTNSLDARSLRYAFVGNLANNLYQRAVPLRKRGYTVELVLHPHDRYAMSQPGWEEFDGEADGDLDIDTLAARGFQLPEVPDVATATTLPQQLWVEDGVASDAVAAWEARSRDSFLRFEDVVRFPLHLSYLPTLRHLQAADVILTSQVPYLAYLSGRPYLAAQNGGDLWLDCSRDDAHGWLNRIAFASANAILATNPGTFAHARRYGMRNAVYLPFMLDDERFSPGEGRARADWEARIGGSFFVLVTSRLDDREKGTATALDGILHFLERTPAARLVVLGWGKDLRRHLDVLQREHLADRVLTLPVAGKRRLVDYLRSADVLVDQFRIGAYGATALEAMGCGLPVIMRLELDQYEALSPAGAPPVLQADSAAAVADTLDMLARNLDERRRAGERHRAWFVRAHGSSTWASKYIAMLAATASGHRFAYAASPLSQPLSDDERQYHERSLEHAPPYLDFSW